MPLLIPGGGDHHLLQRQTSVRHLVEHPPQWFRPVDRSGYIGVITAAVVDAHSRYGHSRPGQGRACLAVLKLELPGRSLEVRLPPAASAGRSLVKVSITALAEKGSSAQARRVWSRLAKQGSWMALPTSQRQASGRVGSAAEEAKQEPLTLSVTAKPMLNPLVVKGVKIRICVALGGGWAVTHPTSTPSATAKRVINVVLPIVSPLCKQPVNLGF